MSGRELLTRACPVCDEESFDELNRRDFLRTAGVAAVAAGTLPVVGITSAAPAAAEKKGSPESVVKLLYESLSDAQKKQVAFDWDYQDPKRGLLRTRISNNWQITRPNVKSDFFTGEQQTMVRDIFEGIIQPDWHAKIDKQLKDDAGGWGRRNSIALFGKPGSGKFEFVLTGRHMTLRCDGDSAGHVAFGGPIFYGHAAQGFHEKAGHPGNVFWPQALAANKIFEMLDGKQRKVALVGESPPESEVGFRGGNFPGIPVTELSADQKEQLQKVLAKLIEPYRQGDRDEVAKCLKAQGGVDKCSLAFYADPDIGGDGMWDNWRLEGPSFVWYFRGAPHVHVWVNVADDPTVKLNA